MTTHLAVTSSKWSRILGKVPACKAWAPRPPSGKVSEDQTEVDCKSCAKQNGFVAAAKAEARGSDTGTCQCCFGSYRTPRGHMSHHGYKRPGHGYDVGYCMGERELPFEKSCERTKALRAATAKFVEEQEQYLQRLQSGEVVELPYLAIDYDAPRGRDGNRPQKCVIIKVGDKDIYGRPSLPGFETRLQNEIRGVKMNIEAGRDSVKFLTEKIDGWKLVE